MPLMNRVTSLSALVTTCASLLLSGLYTLNPSLAQAQAKAEIAQSYAWSKLYETDLFTVYSDERGPAPVFKAEGYIDANIFDVLAVLADVSRRTEWVDNLIKARIVEGEIDHDVTIYEQYFLPWPCDNRDTVVRSVIEKDLTKLEVKVKYHRVKHSKVPVYEDVTRMPVVQGDMTFTYAGCNRSFARMILALDVGGHFPQWAVNQFVKRAPVKTLEGLLEQVARTRGQYTDFIGRYKAQASTLSALPLDCGGDR